MTSVQPADYVSAELPLADELVAPTIESTVKFRVLPKAELPELTLIPQPPVAGWEPRYRRFVIFSDVTSILVGVLAVGIWLSEQLGQHDRYYGAIPAICTTVVSILALMVSRSWSPSVLGQGAEEFRRLGRAMFGAMVTVGLGSLAVNDDHGRRWVFFVIPAIALLAFPGRYILRQLLHRFRRAGRCLLPVMAAGSVDTVRDLIRRTRGASHVGWRVEAVCTEDGLGDNGTGEVDGVPVVGKLDDLADQVQRGGYRIVAVTADTYWSPRKLQELAWHMEGSRAEMVVAPVLMEVAGPRVHVSGVLGMPMLTVSQPVFTGARRVAKDMVDKVGASLLLALLTLPMLVIATMIRLDSRGAAIYKQRRVGRDGEIFTIYKFRTMVTNAHQMKHQLDNEGAGPLFKMKRDPRVTRVGAVLRRYSLDELPQFFNVLSGSMSLVGPRPPLPEESAQYGADVRRRLLVKPGVTGLWQVSGRSDLTWEESVRLDLRYVEDWSLALDAVILWKTARAVVHGKGAY